MHRIYFLLILIFLAFPLLGAEHPSASSWATFFKTLNLIIFFALLIYFLYRPTQRFLASQNLQVREMLKDAEDKIKKAEKLLIEQKEQEETFLKEEKKVREHSEKEIEAIKISFEEALKKEINLLEEKHKQGIQQEIMKVKQELQAFILQKAAQKAEQLVEAEVTPEDRRNFFTRIAKLMER